MTGRSSFTDSVCRRAGYISRVMMFKSACKQITHHILLTDRKGYVFVSISYLQAPVNRHILCLSQAKHRGSLWASLPFYYIFFFPSRHHINVESFYFTSKLLDVASFYFVCLDTCLKSLLLFWAIAFSMKAAAVGLLSWKKCSH